MPGIRPEIVAEARADSSRATVAIASHRRGAVRHAADIESEAELARIEALGCDAGQGYLLGRPAAPEILENQLKPRVVA